MRKKILFVAMIDSIHTHRWLKKITDRSDIDIHILSSTIVLERNENFPKKVIQHFPFPFNFITKIFNFSNPNKSIFKSVLAILYRKIYKREPYQSFIRNTIITIKPDLIHSLETQHAGYLVIDVKNKYFLHKKFPKWWHTNWGSDFYLFSNFSFHKEKIVNLLENINYYSCESLRDNLIAKKLGYKRDAIITFPNTGGFDIDFIESLIKTSAITSKRKMILIKGYQGWSGRALFILAAMRKVHHLLQGYEIKIFSNPHGDDVKISSELLKAMYDLNIEILPKLSHNEMLLYFSKSRLYIGSSISDGISTSFLESLATGCFPMQSNTSTADEWAVNGVNALFFDPEDPNEIANHITRVLENDTLVDTASLINYDITRKQLDIKVLTELANQAYDDILINKD